ncbi:kinase-like protein [Filobasidium floriforme]|uniref:kinase-like protein n=1 Tax=Filobasidium floriforme TaxID=5210 RepID=UPI001E8E4718|nr:kinase-like protein [Filobasidium floriforme]KAH8090946.1 kinase-like protein [Filobasidium floriforme]
MPTAATIESDNAQDGGGANLRRAKSFAKTKDQWNFRPPAEDVYDRLEEFFPKIDLDKPVVQAPTLEGLPETAQQPTETIQTPVPKPHRQPGFNKADARKSIRFVAEGRKKHLSKIAPAVKQQGSSLERKRSSSMWGHKVVEVTPAGIEQGKLPPAPIEETVSDDGPVTMTWVKGDLIGKGTYGRVYLALNATTGDMIAVKQVEMPRTDTEREDARQTGMIEALKSEIALLKDLDHPQVVAYLGWEESPEFLSIFLEYVPGGSVASVYRRHKKFEEQVIKSFTMQILDGLAYLHSLNILHRDLKADNILVDHNGTCKISDFGISKRTNDAYDSIISTNLKGSVFWMAPEVVHSVKGQGYSAKVDIWSLGCVVLEMWAGRRPWGDMEALAAMFQLANTRAAPPVPDDVTLSPVADDFLNKKCFAPSPRDRPVAEELLRHPFITDRDPNWTFMDSKIGRAVAAGTKRRRVEPSQG